jgi:AcrR family transcriptional regulator
LKIVTVSSNARHVPKDAPTRVRILEATWKLLRAGAGAVRLEDVARRAGCSRQAVYLHFGDRTSLLVATARFVDEALGLERRIEPLRRAPDAATTLDRLTELHADYYPKIDDVVQALSRASAEDPAAEAALRDRAAQRRAGTRQVVARIRDEGVLAPQWTVDAATDLLFSITSIDVWRQLVVERGWSKRAYTERMQALLRRALLASRRTR